MMCCGPDHIGPPPGWHDGTAEVETLAEIQQRIGGCSMAEKLAALSSILHTEHQRGSGPGRGPRSTEGGQGRAVPRTAAERLFADLAELSALDPGREPQFNTWAPESLRQDPRHV